MSKTKNEAKYLAVKELHETKNYSIQWMCKLLNIQRSAYYKWLNRTIPENEQENMELAEIIKNIIKNMEVFSDIEECVCSSIVIIKRTIT